MQTKHVNLAAIRLNEANPRTITDDKFNKLIASLLVFPRMLSIRPIVVDGTGVALGGNMRYRALSAIAAMTDEEMCARMAVDRKYQRLTKAEQADLLAYWQQFRETPTVEVIPAEDLSSDEYNEFIIKDNASFGAWDYDELTANFDEADLLDWGLDVWDTNEDNLDGDGDGTGDNQPVTPLSDRFIAPPFSVLDTRKGYWQDRKKSWRAKIGGKGESREKTLSESELMGSINNGVSLFDPVLAEILCKWFTPAEGDKIFDPMAGDTYKGLVFAHSGYQFTGIELRPEQVAINEKQTAGLGLPIKYICDDGRNVAKHIAAASQDLLFSCPPYFDLEKYSDLPNDASNQGTYDDFIDILREAFTQALKGLKNNRFAVIVVGDIRAKNGFYYPFTNDVKKIFAEAGAGLYNELIIVEPIGTLPQRVGRYMTNRKVGKCHQNVLVFFKGDPKTIPDNYKKIEYANEDLESFGLDDPNEAEDAE